MPRAGEYRWYEIQQHDSPQWDITPRNGHRMVRVEGSESMFCYGGHTGEYWLDDAYAFTPGTLTYVAKLWSLLNVERQRRDGEPPTTYATLIASALLSSAS